VVVVRCSDGFNQCMIAVDNYATLNIYTLSDVSNIFCNLLYFTYEHESDLK